MNILFTISYYAPYISGLTVHAERLATAFSKKGHSITVITSHLDKIMLKDITEDGVRIVRIPVLLKFHKGFFMPSYIFRAWQHIYRSEIAVSHLPQFESVFVAIIAKILRRKYYVIYHCEVKLPDGFLNKIIESVLCFVHYITLLCADKIVTYTKDYAINSSLLPKFFKKTVFIYPPIPVLPLTKKTANDTIKKQNNFVIGVAARLATEKGFEYLFSAIPYIQEKLGKSFTIHIAGPMDPAGEGNYKSKLALLLQKYKNYIKFSGTIKPSEMVKFYKSLDVLVLPSINKTEAFGMVQVEAMLCGIPVVASDLPGVREPVKVTGMGEVAEPADSKDLADKILQVLHNKEKYYKNASSVKKIFSYEETISEYEKIFIGFS